MQILDEAALFRAGQAEALDDRNQGDVLPLASALCCAADIAGILRELHSAGRCHGAVAECVVIEPHGATLAPPRESLELVDQGVDVRAFGSLLYEMVTGLKPSGDGGGIESWPAPTFQGPEGVRLAAIRLALRCLETSDGRRPNMQQVLTEVRLFRVLVRQGEPVPVAATPPPHAPAELAAPPAPAPAPAFISSVPESFFMAVDEDSPPRKPSRARCPHCGGPFVYFSQPSTLFERMLGIVGIRLHRCHRCFYRFGVLLGLAFSKE